MINQTFVADVQDRVAHTRCPSCGHSQLEFRLSCDLPHADCLFVGRCTGCGLTFGVDADSYIEATQGDSDGHVQCPTCHGNMATLALACDTDSHSCRYSVQCPDCHGPARSA